MKCSDKINIDQDKLCVIKVQDGKPEYINLEERQMTFSEWLIYRKLNPQRLNWSKE